jgi:protein-S-isoprenylcysteine O-methyltransferase Ste14
VFVEMYGFPLTIYLLSGWLGRRFPQLDVLSHDAGHLWTTVFGYKGDPHVFPLHILSYVLIGAGFWILAASWKVLFEAQKKHELATMGTYGRVRHPQYPYSGRVRTPRL